MSHQHSWAEAFVSGLRRRGWRAELSQQLLPSDLVAMWSIRNQAAIEQARADGREIVIAERGYMGDRKHYCSVSFGGELNGRAEFRGPFNDASRFERLFVHLMHDWQPNPTGCALIMGQVDGDMSTRGVDLSRWYREAGKALEARGWHVRFRPHPLASGGAAFSAYRRNQRADDLDLAADFAAADIVVTYNSNSGVDAALAGRPVIATDAGSMAWDIAGHAFDEIITPDRTAWANRLAWCQWTKAEMASGECAEAIGL
jgi:hypothetical protein